MTLTGIHHLTACLPTSGSTTACQVPDLAAAALSAQRYSMVSAKSM